MFTFNLFQRIVLAIFINFHVAIKLAQFAYILMLTALTGRPKPNKRIDFQRFSQYSTNSFFRMTSILTANVDSRVLRLNCHLSADFKVIKKGEVLQGSVISTFDHLSFQECKAQCLLNKNCKSINFQNADSQICELNNASVPEISVFCTAVFKRQGWTHASISYTNQLVRLHYILCFNSSM